MGVCVCIWELQVVTLNTFDYTNAGARRQTHSTHTLSSSLLRGQLLLRAGKKEERPPQTKPLFPSFARFPPSLSARASATLLCSALWFLNNFLHRTCSLLRSRTGEFYWHGFTAAGRTSAEKQSADWPAEENCFDAAEARCSQMSELLSPSIAFKKRVRRGKAFHLSSDIILGPFLFLELCEISFHTIWLWQMA